MHAQRLNIRSDPSSLGVIWVAKIHAHTVDPDHTADLCHRQTLINFVLRFYSSHGFQTC